MLHMSYSKFNELWYLIGSRMKVQAELDAVTLKSKTTTASGSSTNKVVKNDKVEVFSCLLLLKGLQCVNYGGSYVSANKYNQKFTA
jgi:hypothetical protein